MKTHVITFSRQFPVYHPKKGQETGFVDKILSKVKTSTIRGNYSRWLNILRQIHNDNAIISLRYWSGKPYRSKQIEFARVTSIRLHRVFITNTNNFEMSINSVYSYYDTIERITKMEGFTEVEDFKDWFQTNEFSGALIEFEEIEKVECLQ